MQKDVIKVEQVQRKITKCIGGLSHLPYAERLKRLDLPKLDTRRVYFDLLECYKIVHNLTRSDCHTLISLSTLHTRGYHCKLKTKLPPARLNVRRYFFLERAVSQWNTLPAEIVQQDSYSRFKLLLRNHLHV